MNIDPINTDEMKSNDMKMKRILVVGGGSWGTAFGNYLAAHLADRCEVNIMVREQEVIDSIRTSGENTLFLPGIPLSPYLKPVHQLVESARDADVLVFAVPSKFIRHTFEQLKDIAQDKWLVNLSKGFEYTSLKTISQLARDVFGPDIMERWVTISGPSFARELAQRHPTTVTACSPNPELMKFIQVNFSSDIMRIYGCSDLMGTEVGGSLKNVMAIASGIVKGCGYGYNTTASLVTRASVEIMRFGTKLGARPETFWGLAGIGDLMLTCFGPLSRNFQLGERIAGGETLADIERKSVMVAEGVETTRAVKKLSDQVGIEMPILNQVYQILFHDGNPREALKTLMKRRLKTEWDIS